MKINKAFQLGNSLIISHKKGYFVAAIIVSILFSILTVSATLLQAIENHLVDKSLAITDGRVVTKISTSCSDPDSCDKIAMDYARKYNGNFTGAVVVYESDNKAPIYVISEKTAKYLSDLAFSTTQNSRFNIIRINDDSLFNDIYDEDSYEVAGHYSFINTKNSPISGFVQTSNDQISSYAILDSDSILMNYLVTKSYHMVSYDPVITFDKFNDAYTYYKNEEQVSSIFTKPLEIKNNYDYIYGWIKILIAILFLVSTVVISLLSVIISNKDKKIFTLYRSLGASNKDILTIILASLFEFSCFVLVFTAVFSGIILAIINTCYADFSLFSFNELHILIAFAIVLLAPTCSMASRIKISSKNKFGRAK